MKNQTRKFEFTGAAGQKLDGRLELPLTGQVRAVALFAHCFTCSKASHGATRISAALAAQGIATLRFDFTGLGDSGGEFADSGFAANVDDLVAAANALRDSDVGAPQLIVGHSLGGAAVIAAASRIPELRAVATVGAPFSVDHVLEQLGGGVEQIETDGDTDVTIGGRSFRVGRDFVAQMRDQPQGERLAALETPLLVLHAEDDAIVPFAEGEAIYAAAAQPKSFITLANADHLLTRDGAAQGVATQIAAWADGYLDPLADDAAEVVEGLVSLSSVGGKFTQLVRSTSHQWLADEPKSFGGDDLGPTPYDLLLSALGACTAMTLKMYADRKKWPLTHVEVTLEHSREHREDCETCNNSANQIDIIDRIVTLRGDLDDEQRTRLLEIAEKCPVHRTLTNRIEINTLAG